MKVVLINPSTSFTQLYGDWDLSGVDTYCPPLGLLYLASFIRQHNHDVQIIDMPALKWSIDEATDFVISSNPDVVGLTAMTINVHNANNVAEDLKRKGCKAPIIIGGAHFTAVPIETLKRCSSIDFGVVGEGEITFLEFLNQASQNKAISDINGIVWRNGAGEIVINPPRSLIKDLDILPFPAWDLLPDFPDAYPHNPLETKRLPAASIITSRGCLHQCTYCDRSVFGSHVRHHSAGYTLDMIRLLKNKYGIKDLMIVDDNFLLDRKKLIKICDKIIQEEMNINWYCLSHVRFMTDDRLKKIKEAGCWIMEVGVESGSERILQLLKRNTTKAQIADAIKRAKKIGIKVKGNFIFGLPTETLETLEETIKFATSIDISLFEQNFLTIFPGSELSKYADEYGYAEKDWDNPSFFQISFIPFGLSREDLLRASKIAVRRFYLRPKIIFESLISIRSLRALKGLLAGLRTFLKSIRRKN